jgi:hypothetical protein
MSNNKKSVKPYYMYKPSIDSLKDRLKTSSTTVQALRETFITGIGTGVGFNVAERLVTTVLGPRKVETTIVRSPDCEDINKLYMDALSKNEVTKELKDAYQTCSQS